MRFAVEFLRRLIGTQTILDELHQINKRVTRLEELAEIDTRSRSRITPKIDALLRRDFLPDMADGEYPQALLARRFRLLSQNEEDGMILALLKRSGVQSRTFVEIGSGASGGNSGMLALEFGWRGLMVDIDENKIARARRRYGANPNVSFEAVAVTPGNINDLIQRHGLSGEIDFFSLDIDSFDYWVLQAMTACSPRVMVLEYNGHFGCKRSVTIAPDTDLSRAPKGFHGASLVALTRLAASKGYKLVACDQSGTNAFYLRDDLCPEIKPVDPALAYRPMVDRMTLTDEKKQARDLEEIANSNGLELVEV